MKKTVNKILSVLLSAVMLLTLFPAFAAAGPQEITEAFSARLFSNGTVNEFCKVFPQFTGGIERALHSTPPDSPAYVELDPNGFGFSGDLYVKMNGECDTATFAEFFRAYDINVYPQTLGAYLADHGFGDVADVLLAAEGWSDFCSDGGPAFDFDWGLDEIDGLAERYAAFTDVIALLIDAAKPLFALALGTQDITLNYPGDMQFFKLVSPSMHMEYSYGITLLNKDLTNVVFSDITGSIVIPSLNLYQTFALPLYRALGVGTAIGYTFAAWDGNADAEAMALLLFDPLYALVSAVQNDPDAPETLLSFYASGCEERVAQIDSGCTQTSGAVTVGNASVDFQVSGLASVQQNAVKEALLFLLYEFGNMNYSVDVSAFVDADGIKDRLNAMLPAFTAPASEAVESGACGEYGGANVQWELYSNGLLRVFGEGNMGTYVPLSDYRAVTLVVDDGVTGLCNDAFAWCYGLTEAYIPQSVVSIGEEVFGNCYDLERIYYAGDEAAWDAIAFAEDWFSYSERMAAVVFADGTHRCGACDEETQNYVDGRCELPGSYDEVWFCPICGEETKRITREVEAEPHVWGAWTVLAYPTAADEGLMERRCVWDDTHVETALIPAGEFGEHELLRGYCGGEGDGKNLIWSLSDDDVITVSGTGTMRNYGKYADFGDAHDYVWSSGSTYPQTLGPSVPWPSFDGYEAYLLASWNISTDEDQIYAILNGTLRFSDFLDAYLAEYNAHPYTVVLEEGVTHVGANAFRNMNVTGLSLPSTLEWIGQSAFSGINVESLILPEGVRWLDPYAFSGGTYESVTLPSTLEIAGQYAIGSYSDEHLLSDITVLSADEYLETVLSGIQVKCVSDSQPQYDIGEYRTVLHFENLASDYYFLSHVDETAAQDLEALALELGGELTQEQIGNYYQFLLESTLFDLRDRFGAEFGSVEEGLAYIVAEVNAILGTSLAGDELFTVNTQGDPGSLSSGKLSLTPAADAAYTARFGASFDDMFFKYDWSYSLKELRYNSYDNRVPAQWITLRGHCGSALESEYGELLNFEAVEHDPANGEVITPSTCVTCGETAVTCPVCGQTFTSELPLGDHVPGEPVTENEILPTCTEDGGYDLVTYCTLCGEQLSSEHVVNAAYGHAYTVVDSTAPTCTEAGATEYLCTVCGNTYTVTEAALGHGTLGYDISGAPSTCAVRGYSMTVCIACGEITDYITYELDPDNHNWGRWAVVTPATYLSEGLEQRTCAWCGGTETRPIPVLEPEETIKDPETGIELQLQEGVLPEGTEFIVNEEFDGTYFRLLNREVGNVSSTLYNITPMADGEKVQPDGYVLVRLPIPAGYNPNTLSIYYISTETGATERIDCYIEDGCICFQTTHFSVYAIVDSSATAQEAPGAGNEPGGKLSFFDRLTGFFRRISEWFKKLFTR